MTLSIGVEYTPEAWKLALIDQDQPVELHNCATTSELLALVNEICAHYPEPTIVLALPLATPFCALQTLTDEQIEHLIQSAPSSEAVNAIREVLQAVRVLSGRSYCAPSATYLPTVPRVRRLLRPTLGNASDVCAVVALLYHMRAQDAPWTEMNFLCVNASIEGISILILKDGQIVNGTGYVQGSSYSAIRTNLAVLETTPTLADAELDETFQQTLEEARWEGLLQELAGLLATHHIEDLVVFGQESSHLVERLAETSYQVYLFPHTQTEREGYEITSGAALLARGLQPDNDATALVEHLQIRRSERIVLLADR